MRLFLKPSLAFLIFLMLAASSGAQIPQLSVHQFYGEVVNGVNGDIVKAVVGTSDFTTTVSDGKYGYDPTFNVEGGSAGDTVTFFINNVQVATHSYDEQGLTSLDLTKPPSAIATTTETTEGTTSAPSGGGTSTSTRRSSKKRPAYPTAVSEEAAECAEDWICGSWTECANNQQSRECIDQNACGTELLKPAVVKTCEAAVSGAKPAPPPLPLSPKPAPAKEVPVVVKEKGMGWVWIPIFLIIIALIAGIVIGLVMFIRAREEEVLTKPARIAPFKAGPVIRKPVDKLAPIRAYVQQTRRMGYGDEQIRKALLKAGWLPSQINRVLQPAPAGRTANQTFSRFSRPFRSWRKPAEITRFQKPKSKQPAGKTANQLLKGTKKPAVKKRKK